MKYHVYQYMGQSHVLSAGIPIHTGSKYLILSQDSGLLNGEYVSGIDYSSILRESKYLCDLPQSEYRAMH